jgi:hypothetical protein
MGTWTHSTTGRETAASDRSSSSSGDGWRGYHDSCCAIIFYMGMNTMPMSVHRSYSSGVYTSIRCSCTSLEFGAQTQAQPQQQTWLQLTPDRGSRVAAAAGAKPPPVNAAPAVAAAGGAAGRA